MLIRLRPGQFRSAPQCVGIDDARRHPFVVHPVDVVVVEGRRRKLRPPQRRRIVPLQKNRRASRMWNGEVALAFCGKHWPNGNGQGTREEGGLSEIRDAGGKGSSRAKVEKLCQSMNRRYQED